MRKSHAGAMALICWQLCMASDAVAIIPCHAVKLSRHARNRVAAAIHALTPQPLDNRTLYACGWKRRAAGHKRVWVDTVHTVEADGSQRWRTAFCTGDRQWECDLSGDHRSVDVSIQGYPPRVVEIPLDMLVGEARVRVTQAYSLLATLAVEHLSPGTDLIRGAGEIFEIKQHASQPDSYLKLTKDMTQDGIGRYELAMGPYALVLERVVADDSLRIVRVVEPELVE